MKLRILTEASGSLTSGYLIKAIQQAGALCVASDIDPECFGRHLADDFILMLKHSDPLFWSDIENKLLEHEITMVIPSLDETLSDWSERKSSLLQKGVHVIISEAETIRIFRDKWLTYQFFRGANIPTPETSLEQRYPLVKPRFGRGAVGVKVTSDAINMHNMVSQELVEGTEYTIDVFCDHDGVPIYIIPRTRMGVREGKSTGGLVVKHLGIIDLVKRICSHVRFQGPINMQCFDCIDGSIKFIEINARIAGGMALGFAASENWIGLIIDHFLEGKKISPKPILDGMVMKRFYAEIFISQD